jgi:cupin superfamily acireductone dioxygenase involved in methionine salvage
MAVLRIPDEQRTMSQQSEIRDYLAGIGIEYERWPLANGVTPEASAEQILNAYAPQVE